MYKIDDCTIADPNVPGLSYRIEIHEDPDVSTRDADCYTAKQVAAFKRGDWQYVGVVVTPVIGGTDIEQCRDALWGVEYGDFLLTDEDDNETGRTSLDLDYFITGTREHPEYAYPVPDMISECKSQLAAQLGPIVDALRTALAALT